MLCMNCCKSFRYILNYFCLTTIDYIDKLTIKIYFKSSFYLIKILLTIVQYLKLITSLLQPFFIYRHHPINLSNPLCFSFSSVQSVLGVTTDFSVVCVCKMTFWTLLYVHLHIWKEVKIYYIVFIFINHVKFNFLLIKYFCF